MKNILKTWFVGFLILAPAAFLPATRWLVSEMDARWFADVRPSWWGLICITIYLVSCILIPLFAVMNAKQCLREFVKPKNERDLYSEAVSEIKNQN
jgi:hypothetical protein